MDSGSVNANSVNDTETGTEVSENESLPATINTTEEHGLSVVHNQCKDLHNLNSIFYDPIVRDDVYHSPLCSVSGYLHSEGIKGDDLRASLLSIATMTSARLGHPLLLVIIDDTAKASGLVSLASQMVSDSMIFECMELSPEMLFMHQNKIPGKTIVSKKLAGLKNSRLYLDGLVEHGFATMQNRMTSKITTRFDEVKVMGPVGLVTITGNPEDADFNGTNIIKVHLKPDAACSIIDSIRKSGNVIQPFRAMAFFNRLKARPVNIPYMKQLLTFLEDAGVTSTSIVTRPLASLISIIAHINNPRPVTMDEIAEAIYRMVSSQQICNEDGITATKIDYFYASKLLGGYIQTGNDFITDREIRIYEAVKTINVNRIGASFEKTESDKDKLLAIIKMSHSWADRTQIFEEVNKKAPVISSSTLNNELQVLVEKGIIERQKQPKSTQFKYFITTLHADNSIRLPDASTILDPVFQGKSVKVVNPLTAEVEEIPAFTDLKESKNKTENLKSIKPASPKAKGKDYGKN